jgi:hypothetical protein
MAIYLINFFPKYDQSKHIVNIGFNAQARIFESIQISKIFNM